MTKKKFDFWQAEEIAGGIVAWVLLGPFLLLLIILPFALAAVGLGALVLGIATLSWQPVVFGLFSMLVSSPLIFMLLGEFQSWREERQRKRNAKKDISDPYYREKLKHAVDNYKFDW